MVKLRAPREVGVELIPRASVEAVELFFFWSAIFLSLFGISGGSWLSSILIGLDNPPVLWLLAIITLIFGSLTTTFSILGFRKRDALRNANMGTLGGKKEKTTTKITREHPIYRAFLYYKVLANLHGRVFKGVEAISIDEFYKKAAPLLPADSDDEADRDVVTFTESLVSIGFIEEINTDTGLMIQMSKDFVVDESFESTMEDARSTED